MTELEDWQRNLYQRFRNQPPFKSKKFLEWFRKHYPQMDPHHLIGSMGALKLNDLLLIDLERIEHNQADKERELYFYMYLPNAFNILYRYIKELEDGRKRN